MSSLDNETKKESDPILPKYYKADIAEGGQDKKIYSSGGKGDRNCKLLVFAAIVLIVLVLLGLGIGLGTYYGLKSSEVKLANNIYKSDLRTLLEELQARNVSNSRSVLTGYNNSAEFVMEELQKYGYDPKPQYFSVPVPEENEGSFSVSLFIDGTPLSINYPQYNQFQIMIYSAGCIGAEQCRWGLVSLIEDDPDADYGCDTPTIDVSNKAVLVPYDIARGNCSIYEKAYNLKEAGAAAVIYVSSDTASLNPPRNRVFDRVDGDVYYVDIPSVGVTNATGNQLQQFLDVGDESSVLVTMELSASVTIAHTFNIFAETEDGSSDKIVMSGSHLDSVPAGPGVNDDGSGSMLNLLIAKQIKDFDLKPKNKVRFAWWGAEELGLLGSRFYVANLSEKEKEDIRLYVNFDMVGSINYQRGVYRAESEDNEDLKGPNTVIQNVFEKYFTDSSKTYELVDFSGGSDYRPFLDAGIPAGGLFTGAGSIKDERQFKLFGGMINVPLDPCYHQLCDTVNNVDYDVYEEMTRTAAYTIQTFMEQDNLDSFLRPSKK